MLDKTTTLRLSGKLHSWAKAHAKNRGQTLNGMIRVLLEDLKRDSERRKK